MVHLAGLGVRHKNKISTWHLAVHCSGGTKTHTRSSHSEYSLGWRTKGRQDSVNGHTRYIITTKNADGAVQQTSPLIKRRVKTALCRQQVKKEYGTCSLCVLLEYQHR